MQYEKPRKDGRSGGDISQDWNGKVELRTEAQDGSCVLRIRRQPTDSSGRLSDWRS
jgi:hypothetical protein